MCTQCDIEVSDYQLKKQNNVYAFRKILFKNAFIPYGGAKGAKTKRGRASKKRFPNNMISVWALFLFHNTFFRQQI